MQPSLLSRRLLPFLLTGFSSGLPLLVLVHQLPAWLTDQGVSLKLLAGFALLRLPYSFKYLWAPLLDHTDPLGLGRRRSWMVLSQLVLVISLPGMAYVSPSSLLNINLPGGSTLPIAGLMLIGMWIAFWGATQDIVLDAYRQEVLEPDEIGSATGLHVGAYRMAVLIPGSLALVLKDNYAWSWGQTFYLSAAALIPGLILSFFIKEPAGKVGERSFRHAVLDPFKEFIQRWGWKNAFFIILLIMLYKIGDGLASQLMTPFYRWLGYSFTEIGVAAKQAMLWGGVIGSFAAGIWMSRISIVKALFFFGIAQTLAIGGMWVLSIWKATWGMPGVYVLIGVLILDAIGMALGTAALTTLLSRVTHRDYTATQFALLSSLITLPQVLINVHADKVVAAWGWSAFFLLCMCISLPALIMVIIFRQRLNRYVSKAF